MAENRIELKSVGELLGMSFFIPSYQRGYRWTEQQVKDLLNDVNDYKVKDGDFYCLQPLVVKRREGDVFYKIKNEANNLADVERLMKGSWEVIDGQQRLTTIYIILSCLNQTNLFHLEYATRKDSQDFLRNIDETKTDSNIDYCYIVKAKQTTQEWVEQQSRCNKEFVEEYKKKILNSVQFIWYESVDENPIKVFTRLNIGKIKLTNAELIKALFLNRSNFKFASNDYMILRQREIASEWDLIEYTLQNDEFWLFLKNTGYKRPTRIDFIFELICKQNTLNLEDNKIKLIGSDEYRTFRYFYEYFKSDKSDIKDCWKKVKAYYQTFREWFDDLELYHYIGYLVIFNYSLHDLMAKWNNQKKVDKIMFMNFLKNEIRIVILKKLGFNETEHELKGCDFLKKVLCFQYKEDGSDKGNCKPILLFHNIQTVVNQNKNNLDNEKYQLGVFYKFPFHLYKLENWDVEHINSSTTNEKDDTATQTEFLLNVYLSADENTQSDIREYFEETNEDKKNNLFEVITKRFPQTEEWNSEEKNRIWNYALLDSSTNRSYGNAIFSGKRRVIIGKDKGQLIPIPKITKDGKLQLTEETKAKSSFVPPCTKHVFMKFYSATMSDANYWTKIDADSYLRDIKDCLKELED